MIEIPVRRVGKKERKLAQVMYWVPEDIKCSALTHRDELDGLMYLIEATGLDIHGRRDELLIRKHTFLFNDQEVGWEGKNERYLVNAVPQELEYPRRDIRITARFDAAPQWIRKHLVLMKHPTLPVEKPEEALSWLEPDWSRTLDGKLVPVFRPFKPYVRPIQTGPKKRWQHLRLWNEE